MAEPPIWPSVVQAVASVAAIGVSIVAIGITLFNARRARQERESDRELEARAIAIAIYPSVIDFKEKLKTIDEFIGRDVLSLIEDRKFDELERARVEIPHIVYQQLDRLHVLGDAGATTIQLIAYCETFDRAMYALIESLEASPKLNWDDAVKRVGVLGSLIRTCLSRQSRAVDELKAVAYPK